MIYARPASTFTAILEGAASGLVGTLGIRIENGDGSNHTARTTAGIVELEASSGAYAKDDLVAPDDAGTYVVLWDTGGGSPSFASEELRVTHSLFPALGPSGSDLTTLAAVRLFLQREEGLDEEQDNVIQTLITAVSLAIMGDEDFGREFAPKGLADEERLFSHYRGRSLSLCPYDLRELTSIEIDGEAVDGVDYALRPQPPRQGVYSRVRFSTYYNPNAEREVAITGKWGFDEVPADVTHWCNVTVATWLRRDVSAFEDTFSIDEGRLERPKALPAAVRAGLMHYKRYEPLGI